MGDDLQADLMAYVEAVGDLRERVSIGSMDDGPREIHERILSTRAALDRVEEIARMLSMMRGRAQQAVADAKAAYDDAWADATTRQRPGFGNEYLSAKERDAKHALLCVEQQISLRRVEKIERSVANAYEYVRMALRGMEGVRRDLELRIRLVTMEDRLDH